MYLLSSPTVAVLASTFLVPFSLAANIDITVGANAKLTFVPESVAASVGDTLTFSFFPRNHAVVQSNFANPCQPLSGGFFSGFQPLAAGPGPQKFVVTVEDENPIWVYCPQTTGSHCRNGMAMVVNEAPPPSPNTLEAYKALAARTNVSTVPPAVTGGVFVSGNATSTSPSGSTPSATGTPNAGIGSSTNLPFTGAASNTGTAFLVTALVAAGMGLGLTGMW